MEIGRMKLFYSLLFAITILLFINACGIIQKTKLDNEVRRLCAIDGGITVYETVLLPAEKFAKDGTIVIPAKWLSQLGDAYYYERTTYYEKKGDPEMWRSHTKIIRWSDGKLLGEMISYTRSGGGMLGVWNPSTLRCPADAGLDDLSKQIFFTDRREIMQHNEQKEQIDNLSK